MLSFPLILVRPDSMSIGTMILGVHIHDGLYIIISGGQVTQVGYRVTDNVSIDDNIFSGFQLVNIFGPKRYTLKIRTCFKAWLRLCISANCEEHTPSDGCMACTFNKGNGKGVVASLGEGRKRKCY